MPVCRFGPSHRFPSCCSVGVQEGWCHRWGELILDLVRRAPAVWSMHGTEMHEQGLGAASLGCSVIQCLSVVSDVHAVVNMIVCKAK